MSENLKSFTDLGAVFGLAGEAADDETSSFCGINYPAHYDGIKKIGSIVYFRADRVIKGYAKGAHVRPALVYGLWKNADGFTEKLELMPLTSNVERVYRTDFLIDTLVLKQEFASVFPCKLRTSAIVYADNTPQIFPDDQFVSTRISLNIWPEILARRAASLMFERNIHEGGKSPNREKLVREGFVFEELRQRHVRAGSWQPDIRDDGVMRKPCGLLGQGEVNQIAQFANSYSSKYGLWNNFPPFDEWPMNLSLAAFPRWSKVRQKAELTPQLP